MSDGMGRTKNRSTASLHVKDRVLSADDIGAIVKIIEANAEARGYAKAVADLRREGICGDEMPRAFPGTPDGVCELTYNHASLWHEMPNANGSPCRWRVIAADTTAGQTPGGTGDERS